MTSKIQIQMRQMKTVMKVLTNKTFDIVVFLNDNVLILKFKKWYNKNRIIAKRRCSA